MANGGKAAKISGAGGGGFMMIVCDPVSRYNLVQKLKQRPGSVYTLVLRNEVLKHGRCMTEECVK